jgi:hypothetical protein
MADQQRGAWVHRSSPRCQVGRFHGRTENMGDKETKRLKAIEKQYDNVAAAMIKEKRAAETLKALKKEREGEQEKLMMLIADRQGKLELKGEKPKAPKKRGK